MRTYCFKLYRAKRNKKLHKHINLSGHIYNHLIALHKRYYRMYGKSLNVNKLQKHITKLKKTKKYSHWNNLNSQAIQDIAQRIDRSYKLFFKNKEKDIKSSPPKFKKIKKYKSLTLKQTGYKVDGNQITIMRQKYKFHKSREIEGTIKTITVKRDPLGDIYLYFVCEEAARPVKPRTGKSVGLDFGLTTFLTTSDGKKIKSPLFFRENSKEVKKLNRALSKKQKGSKNRNRTRINLAKAHKCITNQRKDFHFKLAKELAEEYTTIYIEDLNIKAMQKLWGKKISDLGHSNFIKILDWQCHKRGSQLIKIGRFYPSSRTCSSCGFVLEKLPLVVREWTCPDCNTTYDRDVNAAINIQKVGASTFGEEGVRPA